MTSDRELPEKGLTQLDDEMQNGVEDIDGSLVEGLEPDDRLQSGVPEAQRATDLDFIEMTGLTKPLAQAKATGVPSYRAESVDAVEPADFFEEGASDIDATIGPWSPEDLDVAQGEHVSPAQGARAEDEAGVADRSADLKPATVGEAEPFDAVEAVKFFELGVSDMDAEMAQPSLEDVDMAPGERISPAQGPGAEDEAGVADRSADLECAATGEAGPVEPASFVELDMSDVDAEVAEASLEDAGVQADRAEFAAALELLRCQDQDLSTAHEDEEAGKGWREAEGPAGPHEQPIVREPSSLVGGEGFLDESDDGEPTGPRREQAGVSREGPDAAEAAFSDVEPEGGLVTGEEARFPPAAGELGEDAVSGQGTAISGEEAGGGAPEDVSFTEELLAPLDSLVEAEQLLEALETQPREPADDEVEWSDTSIAAPTLAALESKTEPESEEIEQAPYHEPAARHARRRSQRGRVRWPIMRWAVRLCSLAILAAAVSLAYFWLRPRMATPEEALAKAHKLSAQGQYARASQAFLDFIRAHPGHASQADLQFLAGHCLQMASTGTFDERQPNLVRALDVYRGFIEACPAHAKAPRARVLMGQINLELGRYEEAIDLLRDPKLPIKDPDAALPALRMLGRAHAHLGDYDAAESVYLQAASLGGNYSPDLDYVALAELFKLRADRAQSPAEREGFVKAAIEHWTHAVRVPGIDPKSKEKIEWLMMQLGDEGAAMGTSQGPAVAAPDAPRAEGVVPGASALPRAARSAPLPPPAAGPADAGS